MKITSLFADKPYSAIAIAICFAVLLSLPWLHLLSPDSAFYLSAYWITLIGKIMCLALVALALDLVWGYAGILSLGHGLYFALGGYAFGMYLMRESAGDGLPDFMRFLSWTELPWYWVGTEHFAWAMILVLSVPALVAFIFGFFAFRS
ncbi:MAG: urea ABC transporter permease subunit UrtC, partial [Acinetobacter junii]|nr:urea ABC transporter permease subunit UrtC [Acinetobacter junii]